MLNIPIPTALLFCCILGKVIGNVGSTFFAVVKTDSGSLVMWFVSMQSCLAIFNLRRGEHKGELLCPCSALSSLELVLLRFNWDLAAERDGEGKPARSTDSLLRPAFILRTLKLC